MYIKSIKIRNLGLRSVQNVCSNMYNFTINRTNFTKDEVWLVQHYPVFTIGVQENKIKFLIENNIPVVFSNRGGKITYHAPGQLIMYFLINLSRRKITVRKLISCMYDTILSTLKYFSINSYLLNNFPGIYVNNKKICSIGLRIKNGCSFHGMSLNINMNLLPFRYIYACGNDFESTQIADIQPNLCFKTIQRVLIQKIKKNFL
ncbi:MAG: lipoyl(octanoyl) transferase LipB [Buchnera aphidicola (Chaetogeoica yunlongensis)]